MVCFNGTWSHFIQWIRLCVSPKHKNKRKEQKDEDIEVFAERWLALVTNTILNPNVDSSLTCVNGCSASYNYTR